MKHIHLFLSFVLIFSTNLLIARGPSLPTFGNTGEITICVNGSYYLNPSTTNGTFSTLSATIATVNASGYVTGVSVGTTTISLEVTGGGTVTATVTVGPSSGLSITDPLAQPSYKFNNNPQGPIGGVNNYVGYNGYDYSSQSRPTKTGFFRASNQLGDASSCPYEYYIFRCTTCGAESEFYNLSSVTIGSQVWTDKNLDVTTYSDGTIIPQVTDPIAWAGLTTGAWCYYDNNSANGVLYGKLYNWYAVNDARGLAPLGWHIPTDAEFTTLSNNLGGNSVAGNAMMSTGISLWPFPNTNATNSSGFSGLPGGYRHSNASFNSMGQWAVFWSSDAGYNDWQLRANSSTFGKYPDVPKFGFSVRLIKD